MSVSKNTIKEDRSPRLFGRYNGRYNGANLSRGTNHASHFIGSRYILLRLEARGFKVTFEKSLIGSNSRVYGTVCYIICTKIANLNEIDSKRSSSRSPQGHILHPGVTGFVHALSFIFYFLQRIFFNFPNLSGINCSLKLCKKFSLPSSFKS